MQQGGPERHELRRSVAVAGRREDKDDQAVLEQFRLNEDMLLVALTNLKTERNGCKRTWSNCATLLTVTAQPSRLALRPIRSAMSTAVPVTDACRTRKDRLSSGRGEFRDVPLPREAELIRRSRATSEAHGVVRRS